MAKMVTMWILSTFYFHSLSEQANVKEFENVTIEVPDDIDEDNCDDL